MRSISSPPSAMSRLIPCALACLSEPRIGRGRACARIVLVATTVVTVACSAGTRWLVCRVCRRAAPHGGRVITRLEQKGTFGGNGQKRASELQLQEKRQISYIFQ